MPSVYNKNRVTKKGYNLLAESIATKKPVTFTKVVIGDGDDNGLNIDTMINVVSEKLILTVLDGQKDGDGQYLVTAVLSNSTVETGFFPKEVALFAKCGDGEEILYSYSNGGNNVGLIPDKNTPINSEIYNIRTKIGNATNITFVTSDDTYVTKGELTKHNTDEQAHDNRFNAIIQQVNNMITTTDDADKQSLAPTLALVKTMLGNVGIVAKKLETNGYVKFANGFCIQWGNLDNGVGTFPTSFRTTVFFAVATSDTVSGTWGRPVIPMKPVTTLTNVYFTGYISVQEQANTWSTSSFNGRYFCIGI